MANFPTSLDNTSTLPNPTGTSTLASPDHGSLHTNENTAIIAVETKLGIGASTPTNNNFLVGTGTGTSAWSKTVPVGTVVGTTDSQTLTNKILTSPTINSPTITNATITADAITGFTTANTGSVYGVSVTLGIIASAALLNTVNTAALQGASVTAAKMVNGMVAQRQGGTTGAAAWNITGTSNTNVSTTNAFIQSGAIASSATSGTDITVTFPVAYNQIPLVFVSIMTANGSNMYATVNTVTTTSFKTRQLTGTSVETIAWIAIGQ